MRSRRGHAVEGLIIFSKSCLRGSRKKWFPNGFLPERGATATTGRVGGTVALFCRLVTGGVTEPLLQGQTTRHCFYEIAALIFFARFAMTSSSSLMNVIAWSTMIYAIRLLYTPLACSALPRATWKGDPGGKFTITIRNIKIMDWFWRGSYRAADVSFKIQIRDGMETRRIHTRGKEVCQ